VEYVTLGRTGLQIPRLIVGGAGFGDVTDAPTAKRIVAAALDRGVNAFDTSNAYNAGRSEELLGAALGRARERSIVCTKCGFRTEAPFDEMDVLVRGGRLSPTALAAAGITPSDYGLSRYNILRAVDASLRRLGTDRIDLLQLHYWDDLAPVEETLGTLADLIARGKVCYVGLSGADTGRLARFVGVAAGLGLPIASVQVSLNLFNAYPDPAFPARAEAEGVSVLAFGACAAGLLTKDFPPGEPPPPTTRFASRKGNVTRYWRPEFLEYVARFKALADELGRSRVELAQGYAMAQPAVTAMIAGAGNETQLLERIDALDHPLSDEEYERLRALAPPQRT
jgi:aryl-alcohol dehydrogenase-like predicted oxidoreductase